VQVEAERPTNLGLTVGSRPERMRHSCAPAQLPLRRQPPELLTPLRRRARERREVHSVQAEPPAASLGPLEVVHQRPVERAALAFILVVWALSGSGWESLAWGTVLVAAGWPVYIVARRAAPATTAAR